MCMRVLCRKTYAGCQLSFPKQHFLDEDLVQLESCSPDGINPCTDLRRSSQVIFGSSYVGGDCPTCEDKAFDKIEEEREQETGLIVELVDKMKEARIKEGSITSWSEWEWKGENQLWERYRMSNGKYEYEWQGPADTDWSEWELNEERQQWCRGRWLKGKYVTEWGNPEPEDDRGKGKGSSRKNKGKTRH